MGGGAEFSPTLEGKVHKYQRRHWKPHQWRYYTASRQGVPTHGLAVGMRTKTEPCHIWTANIFKGPLRPQALLLYLRGMGVPEWVLADREEQGS